MPRVNWLRRLRSFTVALALFAALLGAWLFGLRWLYRPSESSLRPADGSVSPLALPLLERQLTAWSTEAGRRAEIARMRATNPEWDLMARTYLVLALANASMRPRADRTRYLRTMDAVLDDTLGTVRARGQQHFLLPHARSSAWLHPSRRSVFVDGELALMLGARRMVRDDREDFRGEFLERIRVVEAQMSASPTANAESYPDECWTFCNTVALAAMRVHEAVDGADHHEIAQRWLRFARERLIDPASGMLVSSYRMDGTVLDGAEGSSIYMVAHDLVVIDRALAEQQHQRAHAALDGEWLGFGFAREWPRGVASRVDVDSGPTVPWVGANAGASGMALLGAGTFGDTRTLAGLVASLELAAFPATTGASKRYLASNAVGDAVLLYSLVQGPLWRSVIEQRRARAMP
jgi:hypothetical protein